MPTKQETEAVAEEAQSPKGSSSEQSHFTATGYTEFVPKGTPDQSVNVSIPEEPRLNLSKLSRLRQGTQRPTSSLSQNASSEVLSMGSLFSNPRARRRDDNFELFMDSNGFMTV